MAFIGKAGQQVHFLKKIFNVIFKKKTAALKTSLSLIRLTRRMELLHTCIDSQAHKDMHVHIPT